MRHIAQGAIAGPGAVALLRGLLRGAGALDLGGVPALLPVERRAVLLQAGGGHPEPRVSTGIFRL